MHLKFYSVSEIGVGDMFNQMRSEQAVSCQRLKNIAEESGELVELLGRKQPHAKLMNLEVLLENCSSLRIWRGFAVKSTHCICYNTILLKTVCTGIQGFCKFVVPLFSTQMK